MRIGLNCIMMLICSDHEPSYFRATLTYDLDELIEQHRLTFSVPNDMRPSFEICGYPICDGMLLVDATSTATTPI
jgi:hypothetical protein